MYIHSKSEVCHVWTQCESTYHILYITIICITLLLGIGLRSNQLGWNISFTLHWLHFNQLTNEAWLLVCPLHIWIGWIFFCVCVSRSAVLVCTSCKHSSACLPYRLYQRYTIRVEKVASAARKFCVLSQCWVPLATRLFNTKAQQFQNQFSDLLR